MMLLFVKQCFELKSSAGSSSTLPMMVVFLGSQS